MRILCVIDNLGSGGAQRQLTNLAIGFKERGHTVSFLTYHPHNFFKEMLDEVKIPIETVTEPIYFKRLLKMRSIIRKGNYDSVLSFLEAPSFICELAGLPYRKWKLVVGERNADPKIFTSLRAKFFRYMHMFADAVVANSNANVKLIARVNPFIFKSKCHTIYNMVDINVWKPSDNYIIRKNGKTEFIVVASHQYAKNAKSLIEALNLLSDNEKSLISIKWYGGESSDNSFVEARELLSRYKLNDVLEFLSPVKNIHEKMKDSDCCALFSYHEGLPNTICEGMALGKPVIGTKVSDVPKLIKEGLGGYLCNAESVESIVKVIRNMMNCSNEQLIAMGKYNRKRAISLFNKEKIIERYIKVLQNA